MENAEIAEPAEMDEKLKEKLDNYIKDNYLVVVMAGGDADDWIRQNYEKQEPIRLSTMWGGLCEVDGAVYELLGVEFFG